MDKEAIHDRINELQFKREWYVGFQNVHIPILFTLMSIFFTGVGYYSAKKQTDGILLSMLVFVIVITGAWLTYFYSTKKNKELAKRIENNYDLLLGRKTINPREWGYIVRNKKY